MKRFLTIFFLFIIPACFAGYGGLGSGYHYTQGIWTPKKDVSITDWYYAVDGTNALNKLGASGHYLNRQLLTFDGTDYLTVPGLTVEDKVTLSGWEYGPELVVNGWFDTDEGWVEGTGWAISGGVASCDGTQTDNTYLDQAGVGVASALYLVSVDVDSSAGAYQLKIGTAGIYTAIETATGSRTDTYCVFCSGSALLRIRGNAYFVGSIDNVSVREITNFTALGSCVPTVSSNKINFTAGSVGGIEINDVLRYTCEEGQGDTLYAVDGSGVNATIVNNSPLATMWGTLDTNGLYESFALRDGFNPVSVFDGVDDYIDTGIIPTTDTVIELNAYFYESALRQSFGVLDGGASYSFSRLATTGKLVLNFGSGVNQNESVLTAGFHTIRIESGTLYLDGIADISIPSYSFATATLSLQLGNWARSGTRYPMKLDAMHLKIWKSGVLVRDMRPSITTNGAMVDTITGTVYPNQGTGDLGLGRIPAQTDGSGLDALGNTLDYPGGHVHNGAPISMIINGTTNSPSDFSEWNGFESFPVSNIYVFTNTPSKRFQYKEYNVPEYNGIWSVQ